MSNQTLGTYNMSQLDLNNGTNFHNLTNLQAWVFNGKDKLCTVKTSKEASCSFILVRN